MFVYHKIHMVWFIFCVYQHKNDNKTISKPIVYGRYMVRDCVRAKQNVATSLTIFAAIRLLVQCVRHAL